MESRKAIKFCFALVAIILGVTLFKQFDFEKGTFEKPGLAIVYTIAFIISIYVLLKKANND